MNACWACNNRRLNNCSLLTCAFGFVCGSGASVMEWLGRSWQVCVCVCVCFWATGTSDSSAGATACACILLYMYVSFNLSHGMKLMCSCESKIKMNVLLWLLPLVLCVCALVLNSWDQQSVNPFWRYKQRMDCEMFFVCCADEIYTGYADRCICNLQGRTDADSLFLSFCFKFCVLL